MTTYLGLKKIHVVSNITKQWYELTQNQLSLKIGKDAEEASAESKRIQELGHRPAIFYSEFDGYRIFDKDSLGMQQAKTLQSIRSNAKPAK